MKARWFEDIEFDYFSKNGYIPEIYGGWITPLLQNSSPEFLPVFEAEDHAFVMRDFLAHKTNNFSNATDELLKDVLRDRRTLDFHVSDYTKIALKLGAVRITFAPLISKMFGTKIEIYKESSYAAIRLVKRLDRIVSEIEPNVILSSEHLFFEVYQKDLSVISRGRGEAVNYYYEAVENGGFIALGNKLQQRCKNSDIRFSNNAVNRILAFLNVKS